MRRVGAEPWLFFGASRRRACTAAASRMPTAMSLSRCVARQPRPVCSGLGAATANGASARQKNRRCSDESGSPRAIKDRRVTSPIRLTCGITGPELCPLRAGSRPAQFLRATERFLEERNLAAAGPLQTRGKESNSYVMSVEGQSRSFRCVLGTTALPSIATCHNGLFVRRATAIPRGKIYQLCTSGYHPIDERETQGDWAAASFRSLQTTAGRSGVSRTWAPMWAIASATAFATAA